MANRRLRRGKTISQLAFLHAKSAEMIVAALSVRSATREQPASPRASAARKPRASICRASVRVLSWMTADVNREKSNISPIKSAICSSGIEVGELANRAEIQEAGFERILSRFGLQFNDDGR